MKLKTVLLTTGALGVLIASCKKNDEPSPAFKQSFTVKINGRDLVYANSLACSARFFKAVGNSKDNDSIIAFSMSTYVDNYAVEHLAIDEINVKQRVNQVRRSFPVTYDKTTAIFALGYADAIDDDYDILESDSSTNEIVIDSYDAVAKRVKGHFGFTMYRMFPTAQPADLGYADTLHFTDGKFDLIVK
jgi:hypothetical protein